MNMDNEIFVVLVAALAEPITIPIHPSGQAQVASPMSKKTRIPVKYSEFSNVFSSDSVAELPEHTRINDHLINLIDDKELPMVQYTAYGKWS